MENAHCVTAPEALSYFNVKEESGLSDFQVKDNQAKYGPNGEQNFVIDFLNIKF